MEPNAFAPPKTRSSRRERHDPVAADIRADCIRLETSIRWIGRILMATAFLMTVNLFQPDWEPDRRTILAVVPLWIYTSIGIGLCTFQPWARWAALVFYWFSIVASIPSLLRILEEPGVKILLAAFFLAMPIIVIVHLTGEKPAFLFTEDYRAVRRNSGTVKAPITAMTILGGLMLTMTGILTSITVWRWVEWFTT